MIKKNIRGTTKTKQTHAFEESRSNKESMIQPVNRNDFIGVDEAEVAKVVVAAHDLKFSCREAGPQ